MRDRDAEKELIKERVRIEELVREVVPDLQARGNELWTCCPFHAEDTASFHIRPALGLYYCFGCGAKGDVITFVMQTHGVGFVDALTLLADRAGIELSSMSDEDKRRQADARRQREVLSSALTVFRKAMGTVGQQGLAYLKDRGFTRETLLDWDVGFIPDDFVASLAAEGLEQRQIDGAGFTGQFRGRLAFGIRDGFGTLVGFGARILGDGDGPKYVNTRETPTFSKGRLLYGLNKASKALSLSGRLVVMEGYTDVMMAHQQGLDEAVATMGTSFTAQHLELVRARVTNLVFVFDGDEAGQRAAERATGMMLEAGLECRVLLLPDGSDPGEWFATRSRADFETLLAAEGLSTVRFLCRRGLGRLDAGQPGGREAVAQEVVSASAAIRDPVRRESIVADIARECGVDRNLLRRGGVRSAPAGFRPPNRSRAVSASVRCQYAVLAGLVTEAGCLADLDELAAAGALVEGPAVALLAIARELVTEGRPVDPMAWVERVEATAPELQPVLDRLLFPPRDVILPRYSEALEHLRQQVAERDTKAARRAALSRPDVANDPKTLQDIAAGLRRTASTTPTINDEPGLGNES